MNCRVHPSLQSKPLAKFSPEWIDLELDKTLSRWLQLWRPSFQVWAKIALDLANHPPERVMTHCMQLIIQPRNFEDDPAKEFHVVNATLVAASDIQANYPELEMIIDPTDFLRLRYLVFLQNYKGELRRLRLIQWSDLNVGLWRNINKDRSAELASSWDVTLINTVDSMDPKEVEKLLGRRQS